MRLAFRAVYRLLLRAMPAPFRSRYGAEAYTLAARRVDEARGLTAVRLAGRELVDLLKAIRAERRRVRAAVAESRRTAPAPAGSPRLPVVMDVVTRAVRHGLRGMRRSPGFTAGVIAILVLGLGINVVTFGLAARLFLSGPLGLKAPDRLRHALIEQHRPSGAVATSTSFSYRDYRDLRGASAFSGVAAESSGPLLFGEGAAAEPVPARLVSANYFALLGVTPAAGRFFTEDESVREGARLAVLSDVFWHRRFGGARDVLGRVVPIGHASYTVIGITPPDFTGDSVTRTDVFLPLEAASSERVSGNWRTNRGFTWFNLIVRLGAGVTAPAAADQAAALLRAARAGSADEGNVIRVELRSINPIADGTGQGKVALLIVAVAFLVLAIAMANVTNLFVARSLRRREETGVRVALGATRLRVVAEDAIEGGLFGIIGALVAVAVAAWIGPRLPALLFPNVDWLHGAVNREAVAAIVAIAATAGALSAGLAAWQTSRPDAATSSTGARSSRRRTRTQAGLLVVQGALSVMLLVGAGLFVQSLARVRALDLGIDTDRVLVVNTLPGGAPTGPDSVAALESRVRRVPGVASTAIASGTVPFMSSWSDELAVPGLPERPRIDDGGPYLDAVTSDYFPTVGTRIVQGRAFTAADRAGTPLVAIVNETMAHLFWPGQSALGKCLQIGAGRPPCSTIVGVAEDTRRQEVIEGDSLLYYVPLEQEPADMHEVPRRLLVRTTTADPVDVARVAETVRRTVFAVDPHVRYVRVRSLDEILSPQVRVWRLGAILFSIFGLLALVVAGTGLYSVVSFDLEGRRREVGVRFALGASPASVFRFVLTRGLRLALAGIVLGLAAAWLFAPLTSDLLYSTSPHEWVVFLVAPIALAVVVVVAALAPAWRARRIDPVVALREP